MKSGYARYVHYYAAHAGFIALSLLFMHAKISMSPVLNPLPLTYKTNILGTKINHYQHSNEEHNDDIVFTNGKELMEV